MAPSTLYSAVVIGRMFSPEAKKQFDADYDEEASKTKRGNWRRVSEQDLMILYEYKKLGMAMPQLAKKYGRSVKRIRGSIRIAALSKV